MFEGWIEGHTYISNIRTWFASRNIHELEVPENDRAHYSKRTVDFEFDFPIGRKSYWVWRIAVALILTISSVFQVRI